MGSASRTPGNAQILHLKSDLHDVERGGLPEEISKPKTETSDPLLSRHLEAGRGSAPKHPGTRYSDRQPTSQRKEVITPSIESAGSLYGSTTTLRSRTPEGPKSNTVDSLRNDPTRRKSPTIREASQGRIARADPSRTSGPHASRDTSTFRAPPPTGPRASTSATSNASALSLSTVRSHQPGRNPSGGEQSSISSGRLKTTSSLSLERSERQGSAQTLSSSSKSAALDRLSQISPSDSDGINLPRSAIATDVANRAQLSLSESAPFKRENLASTEIPRGPSDRRSREKRVNQDEDPRRLSRMSERELATFQLPRTSNRTGDDKGSSSKAESVKTSPRDHSSRVPAEELASRPTRAHHESRSDQNRVEGTKISKSSTSSNWDERDSKLKDRSNANGRNLPEDSKDAVETKGESKEGKDQRESRHVSRESHAPERTVSHRTRTESLPSRNQQTPAAPISDAPARTVKDEHRETKHESRDGHRRRTGRSSPTRTRGDRDEKIHRDRGIEKSSDTRRDSREIEIRERDRGSRDDGYRRDSRDRDRSSRDRDADDRRTSRKHDRDRSPDGSGKVAKSGDERSTEDANAPLKRRRMAR